MAGADTAELLVRSYVSQSHTELLTIETDSQIKFKYVKYEGAPADTSISSKPNGVSLAEYSKALNNNQHDLKKIARFEVDRANRKVERAANQKIIESKKQ